GGWEGRGMELLGEHAAPTRQVSTRERVAAIVPADGHVAVEAPMAGSVLDVRAAVGRNVTAGETLLVISAMKMETEVQAPCAGVIAELAALPVGAMLDAGQVVAAIEPRGTDARAAEFAAPWQPLLDEVRTLH